MRGLLLPALLSMLLAACAGDPFAGYVASPGAVQRPHPQTMPQTGRTGALLTALDPEQSFFPLGLGGALVDYRDGVRHGFRHIADAGFNSVAADPEQPLPALLRAAEGSRVQLLRPSGAVAHPALLDASGIRALPVTAQAGASVAAGREGIDAFAAAVKETPGRPVWAILQVHARATAPRQPLPHPALARAMAFGALASGAAGLIWQGEDNYAARNAGALGIAPAPQLDYGIQTYEAGNAPAYRATPEDVAASKRLWDAVAVLNRRIGRLLPALLLPDATDAYSLALREEADGGLRPSVSAPLRSLLKPWDGSDDGRRLLMVVNLEDRGRDFRLSFDGGFRHIERWQEDGESAPEQDAARGMLRDSIAPYGLRLYRVTR